MMKINFPKVSIVIPVYNGEKYLERCVDSALEQTYPNYEIIIVDDGSTDSSRSIISKYASNHKNIIAIYQENSGVSAARNRGLSKADGEWICFVDADDILNNSFVDKLMTAITGSGAELALSGFRKVSSNDENDIISNFELENAVVDIACEKDSIIKMIDKCILNTVWGGIYSLDVIKRYGIRFPLGITYGEDTIFNIDYCLNINKIVTLDLCLYDYSVEAVGSANEKYRKNINKMYYAILNHVKQKYIEKLRNDECIKQYAANCIVRCNSHYFAKCKRYNELRDCISDTLNLFRNDTERCFLINFYGTLLSGIYWNRHYSIFILLWKGLSSLRKLKDRISRDKIFI